MPRVGHCSLHVLSPSECLGLPWQHTVCTHISTHLVAFSRPSPLPFPSSRPGLRLSGSCLSMRPENLRYAGGSHLRRKPWVGFFFYVPTSGFPLTNSHLRHVFPCSVDTTLLWWTDVVRNWSQTVYEKLPLKGHCFVSTLRRHTVDLKSDNATFREAPAWKHSTSCQQYYLAYLKMSGFTPYWILAFFGPPYFLDVFTPQWILANFGRSPLFQPLGAFFWPKRRPTILNVYPTRNFGHFWAALSKMSLNFQIFWAGFVATHSVQQRKTNNIVSVFLTRLMNV